MTYSGEEKIRQDRTADRNDTVQPPRTPPNLVGIAITTVIFSLPAISGGLAWLHLLVPVPVFYYLRVLGQKEGAVLLANAVLAACIIAMLSGGLSILLFSFTFLPMGFVLFRSADKGDTPSRAGLKCVIALGATWTVFWMVYGAIYQVDFYKEVLTSLDKGLDATYSTYIDSVDLPLDAKEEIGKAFERLRHIIPKIFPSLLVTAVVSAAWLNIIIGHWLLKKKDPALSPWKDFTDWHLPELLVWGVILGGVLLFLPGGTLNILGLNILLVLGNIYMFQGLAVLSSVFVKWSVPRPFRYLVYMLIVIQAYGIILLALVGLVDVWADFRKTHQKTT